MSEEHREAMRRGRARVRRIIEEIEIKREEKPKDLVNLRLGKKTLAAMERLKVELEASNRAQVVSYAVRLTDQIVDLINQGAKLRVEHKNGKKERLLMFK